MGWLWSSLELPLGASWAPPWAWMPKSSKQLLHRPPPRTQNGIQKRSEIQLWPHRGPSGIPKAARMLPGSRFGAFLDPLRAHVGSIWGLWGSILEPFGINFEPTRTRLRAPSQLTNKPTNPQAYLFFWGRQQEGVTPWICGNHFGIWRHIVWGSVGELVVD